MDKEDKAYPLLGSIANAVGMGFLGNDAVVAVANQMRVRVVSVPTSWASARGGIDGRLQMVTDPVRFKRAVTFLLDQQPSVVVIGYLPTATHVTAVAESLTTFKGLVIYDPVMGDYRRGLYVSAETARAIRAELVGHAQVITPNRFEAELLLSVPRQRNASERMMLDGLAAMGPETGVITSFVRNAEKREIMNAFSNGYTYQRIFTPFYTAFPGYGAGDSFTAALAVFMTLGATPFASAMLASSLASLAVLRTTTYGGATVDPVGAFEEFRPRGYIDDEPAIKYVRRFGVTTIAIPSTEDEAARLKFAPPVNQIIY